MLIANFIAKSLPAMTTNITGMTARVALGSSMSLFAIVAVLGNILFWFALLYDKRVGNGNVLDLCYLLVTTPIMQTVLGQILDKS